MFSFVWKKFRDLKINQKTLIFSAGAFLLIVLALVTDFKTFLKISDASTHLQKHVEFLSRLGKANWAIINYAQAHFEYADEYSNDKKVLFIKRSEELKPAFDSLKQFIEIEYRERHDSNNSPDLTVNNLSFSEFLDQEMDKLNQFTQKTLQAKNKDELKIIHKEIHPATFDIIYDLQDVNYKISVLREDLIFQIDNLKKGAINGMIYIYLLVLFGMLLIRFLIHITINKPLVDLERVMKQTNFSKSLRANEIAKDEIGNLARSYNKMMQHLRVSYDSMSEETQRVKSILENIGDGVIVTDSENKIIIFNPMAELITGFRESEALNEDLEKILIFKEKEHFGYIQKNLTNQGYCKPENYCDISKKSGGIISVKGAANRFQFDEHDFGSVYVIRDATKEKEVNEMKSEFVSITSHQLNSPLTAVQWAIEVIVSEKFGKLNDEQRNILKSAYKSNSQMRELVKDLLDISRIETGRLKLKAETLDLKETVAAIIESMVPIIEPRKQTIVLECESSFYIDADKTYFRQVIQNLLSNASKYSGESKNIAVKVTNEIGMAVVSVRDEGIGIPIEEQKNLFQKFYRAGNTGENEGNGLGLYIIKEIVQRFKGRIWFESIEGRGSVFYVSIPINKESNKRKGGEYGKKTVSSSAANN
ncbi:TPA: hypothetical protein DDW69_03870 [candidate division CPR2 bacterium]|uniref:histidine kinase n=1 Tax=candidate division CPR2 bacterium GW2011_GWC1_41_48 TaxID=1618344 RepID=A0A0G0WA83_UNCC2|nr:MAG: Multi-sensor signal transduction histidine kinase [candidate division CPR2 bacterium GW2011_GWC2_39_35]KKR28456.1 MAG: Multi-sensor signal transduction histidine kinase [candidate division CPR2 bacterium GW2011_GWD1_39_7]KKR28612.1 MAG: Multi-sensor signal transduction histidine kinase [candidate division CPR2 bacterium GW2011_GWD2_39_7]KKS08977.1 MAG: Multi-sensor signal transduction histidine kinase [candidate division CPR2 bacterium GW2011_GWC1_41_48]OGB60953.1 MAG: hypothetical prot